jgi:hypothetical protein
MRLIKHMRCIYHIFISMSRKIFYFPLEDESFSKRSLGKGVRNRKWEKGMGSQWTWKKEVKIK